MIVWFVHASVLLARKDADDHRQQEAARQLLAGDATLTTLDLAFYEVGNVDVRAWRDVEAAGRLRGPEQQPSPSVADRTGRTARPDQVLTSLSRGYDGDSVPIRDRPTARQRRRPDRRRARWRKYRTVRPSRRAETMPAACSILR